MPSTLLFSLAAAAVLAFTVFIEFAIRRAWLPFFIGRKLLHVLAISTTAWIIDFSQDSLTLGLVLMAIGVLLMVVLLKFKWWLQQEFSYGIALFPISLGGLLALGVSASWIATAAWVLALSDASAGLVGRTWGAPKLNFLSESKSYQGAFAFFATASIVMAVRFPDLHLGWWLLLSLIPTLTELFSWRGSDNFFLPIFTVGWIQLVLQSPYLGSWIGVLAGGIVVLLLAWFVRSRNWLDQTGSLAALWIAAILWMSGGWKALSAPVFLLVVGSVTGKLIRPNHASEKRTAQQVFSNGLIGVVLYMLYGMTGQFHWLLLAWSSFAISVCDTISSEVGVAVGGRTYNAVTLRRMPPGLSGGISLAGTAGGLAALLLLVLFLGGILPVSPIQLLWVLGTGFIGMLVDSILGSKWQALWMQGEAWSEVSSDSPQEVLVKGLPWLDNHWVNFLSNGITMTCSYLAYAWFYL
ncbi:MAG: hypothetical protein RL558_69 [Bacteroidota bacterium]